MKTITEKELNELKLKGHVVFVYVRKGIAVIDGFKYYKIK